MAGPRGDSSLILNLIFFLLPLRCQKLIVKPVIPLNPCFFVVSEPEENHKFRAFPVALNRTGSSVSCLGLVEVSGQPPTSLSPWSGNPDSVGLWL